MNCRGCGRENKPHRRFCGGCGRNLEPTCRGCGFENDLDDRFCGGCGDRMGLTPSPVSSAAVAPAPAAMRRSAAMAAVRPAAISAVRAAVRPDDGLSAAELAELLAPPEATEVVALPDGAISQDDLDKLFGGSS